MKTVQKALVAAGIATLLGGCATTKTVDRRIEEVRAETNRKIETIGGQVEDLQQKQQQTDVRLDQLSQESREALKRAQEAGVLAKGKVVFEQAFTEDRVKFKLDSYDLDK